MKHFGILEHATFYQGTPASDFKHGNLNITSPTDVDPELIKFGIHSKSHLLFFLPSTRSAGLFAHSRRLGAARHLWPRRALGYGEVLHR